MNEKEMYDINFLCYYMLKKMRNTLDIKRK